MIASAKIITLVASASIVAACHSSKPGADASAHSGGIDSSSSVAVVAPAVTGGKRPSAVVAKTRIYKTNGDYNDNVPVTLNADGTAVVSYPAPSDLAGASPVSIRDGYLLDRRGVGKNTAFTRYTYTEYSRFSQPPAPEELLKAVIPGAKVIEIIEMPFATGTPDAASRCDSLIVAGFPGCSRIYPTVPQLTITRE